MTTEIKREINNKLDEIIYQTGLLEDTVSGYRNALADILLKEKLNGIEVSGKEFAHIYDCVMGKFFDVTDDEELEDEIMNNSPLTIEWRGMKCEFYNCAALSNILMEAIIETYEEAME